eukprot:6198458-Pleurochrysis_carterae.AAC.1
MLFAPEAEMSYALELRRLLYREAAVNIPSVLPCRTALAELFSSSLGLFLLHSDSELRDGCRYSRAAWLILGSARPISHSLLTNATFRQDCARRTMRFAKRCGICGSRNGSPFLLSRNASRDPFSHCQINYLISPFRLSHYRTISPQLYVSTRDLNVFEVALPAPYHSPFSLASAVLTVYQGGSMQAALPFASLATSLSQEKALTFP